MKKKERTSYIFQKKSLLILLFLFYINDVDYSSLTLRSFGFSFDPTCNFKVIIKSKKDHIHKYVVHIFSSLNGVNLESLDVMGNVNIIKIAINFYFQIISAVSIFAWSEKEIVNMLFLLINDIHITENAVFPKHILTLEICAVAPFVVHNEYFIFAVNQKIGYIELGGIMRALGIADVFCIYIKCKRSCHTKE